MKRDFLSKPIVWIWGAGFLFSFFLILISGGSAGSVFFRLVTNALLITLFVFTGNFIWKRFLLNEAPVPPSETEENHEEDEIILESDSNRGYTENTGEKTDALEGKKTGDVFSDYRYSAPSDPEEIRHLDNQNPYQMSDSLLRKLKAEEEDSVAKFKAAFQSPEDIAKAIRTELHKDD